MDTTRDSESRVETEAVCGAREDAGSVAPDGTCAGGTAAEESAPESASGEAGAPPEKSCAPDQSSGQGGISADVIAGLVQAGLAPLEARIKGLHEAVEAASRQFLLMPPQVRMLTAKVDGVATAISEPKYRALLIDVVRMLDLVNQVLCGGAGFATVEDYRRGYKTLSTQLRQILALNGLEEIPAEGAFNGELHRASQRAECSDAALDGQIKEVLRPGLRTQAGAILRFADVAVWCYVPPKAPEATSDASSEEGEQKG